MKNIILNLLLIILSTTVALSQCDDFSVQTPNGSDVKACSDGNYTAWEIQQADWQTRAYAIQVFDNATDHYNCHSYAWHISESGNEVWINNVDYEPHNIDNYWLDGSYIELANQPSTAGIKVFYGSNNIDYLDDHSAVTTSSSSIFKSKMGCGVLCTHLINNSPYDYSDLKYYAPLSVSGPQKVCSGTTATFSTPDYVNCDYDWTYHTGLLEPVSGQGTRIFVVEPKSSSSNGLAWVKLTLTIGSPVNETLIMTKNISVGGPVISSISGPLSTPNYQWATYYANLQSTLSAPTDYTWILNPLNGNSVYDYGMSCDIAFYNTGSYQLVAQAQNVCGTGPYYVTGVYVYDSYSLMISPNPSTGETVLSIESTSKEKTFDADAEWEYEVYTDKQLLMQKQTSVKGTSSTINTTGWKDGVYFIRVIYKNEVLQGKLVVKH